MRSHLRLVLTFVSLAVLASACNCEGGGTVVRSPRLQAATEFDFGSLQVGMTHTRAFKVRNTGNGALTIVGVVGAGVFGSSGEFPVVINPSEEGEVLLTFSPVAEDQRESTTITIESDDSALPEYALLVSGRGVEVAEVAPEPLDFGDVYLGEPATRSFSVTNRSSEPLEITGATFEDASAGLGGALTSLVGIVEPGKTTTVELTANPTAMGELAGSLVLTFEPTQRGPRAVAVSGRAIAGLPRLCFHEVNSGSERCSAIDVIGPSVGHVFPKQCDPAITPDGECDAPERAQIQMYVRNEGNVPVRYTATITTNPLPFNPCDPESPVRSDFTFSGAPVDEHGATPRTWTVPVTQLPASEEDPKPWETAPVTITYTASSECLADTADTATVVLTRQGPSTRAPAIINATLIGGSLVPNPKAQDWACQAANASSCTSPLVGVQNQSPEEKIEIRSVRLFEPSNAPNEGRTCSSLSWNGDPSSTAVSQCDFTQPQNPFGDCYHFGWRAGEAPEDRLPLELGLQGQTPPVNSTQLGTLVFGNPADPDALCNTPGTPNCGVDYCLFALIETSSPYSPPVVAKIRATASKTGGP